MVSGEAVMIVDTSFFPDAESLPVPSPSVMGLRVELYGAMQVLKGNDLENLKALIGELALLLGDKPK